MRKINYPVLVLALIFLTVPSGAAPANGQQGKEQVKEGAFDPAQLERAVEKAIRKIERDKAFKERQFIGELKSKLNTAVQEWIFTQRQKRQSQLDKIIPQNWEIYPNAVTAGHYEYYLRDFVYLIGDSDIIKTGSVVNPYKAYFKVSEALYVEREHSSNVSYPQLYLFQVTTPIEVFFDYRDGNFFAAEVKTENAIFKKGWGRKSG